MESPVCMIIKHILTILAQTWLYATIESFFFMYFYLFATEKHLAGQGWIRSVVIWFQYLRKSKAFRRLYILALYSSLILFRTLLCRNIWVNPISKIFDNWWIYEIDSVTGEQIITVDCIENLILFIPFSILFLCYRSESPSLKNIIGTVKVVFIVSSVIEFAQLFLKIGFFQFSDLFYNTVGGFIGCLIYVAGVSFLKFKTKVIRRSLS